MLGLQDSELARTNHSQFKTCIAGNMVTWCPKSRPRSKQGVVPKSRMITRRRELGTDPEVKRLQLCCLPLGPATDVLGMLDGSGHKDINVELLTLRPEPAGDFYQVSRKWERQPRGDMGCLRCQRAAPSVCASLSGVQMPPVSALKWPHFWLAVLAGTRAEGTRPWPSNQSAASLHGSETGSRECLL